MDKEKIEELKKLARPIQDFMASSDMNSIKIKIEGNNIFIEYSGSLEIHTHYHSLEHKNNMSAHTFNYK